MTMRNKLHTYFINHPDIGFVGYEAVRFLKRIKGVDGAFKYIKKLGFNPKVVYDIGANRAEWSRNLKKIFPNAEFILFEPQAELEPFLKRYCNDYIDSKYFLTALGKSVEMATIELWDDYAGTTLLHENTDKPTREIPVDTIDNMVSNGVPKPDLLKLDVQGYELTVLQGATKCFGYTEVVLLEIALYSLNPNQPIFSEVVSFMDNNGYIVYDILSLHRERSTDILRYMDVIFVAKDSELKLK